MSLKEKIVPCKELIPAGHTIFKFIDKPLHGDMRRDKAFRNLLINVGSRLADLRVKKGYLTIKAFASKYDLPEIQYWRIEKGKANITLRTLTRILHIHNMTLQDFFCLVNDEKLAA